MLRPFPLRHLLWAVCLTVCGAACTDEGADLDRVPTIIGLEIADNPHSGQSCVVRWATDVPATSRVEFGKGDDSTYFLGHDEPVTVHEVVVFGMHADSTYRLQVVSVAEDGTEGRSEELIYVTAPFPYPTLLTEVTHLDEERVEPGWTLTNLAIGTEISQVAAVMYDMHGEVVWYYEIQGQDHRADVEVSLVEGDHVLIGGAIAFGLRPVEVDLGGDILWAGPEQRGEDIAIGGMHHTFQKLPNGDYITMFFDFQEGLVDVIEEFDADLRTTWDWNTYDYLPDSDSAYSQGNALQVDLAEDVVYYNAHVEGRLYKIDRSDGEVLWTLGAECDFELTSGDTADWFMRTHAPTVRGNGRVLFYDNGTSSRGYSRIVEYALDEEAMVAELVWEYPGDLAEDVWYNHVWGDADRLPDGNTLITAGSANEDDDPSRILEVARDGTKIWEMWLGSTDPDELVGSYKSQRVPVLVGTL